MISVTVVDGDGGAAPTGVEVHPSGPDGALTCVAAADGVITCTGTTAGTYAIGVPSGLPAGVLVDTMCVDAGGMVLDPTAMSLTPSESDPSASCIVSITRPASDWTAPPSDVASEAPVPGDGEALPSTGWSGLPLAFLAVGLVAMGAGLRTVAKRTVR